MINSGYGLLGSHLAIVKEESHCQKYKLSWKTRKQNMSHVTQSIQYNFVQYDKK